MDLHLDVDDFIDTVLLECFVRSSQFVVDVVSVLFLRNRRKFNAIVMPVFAAWIEPVLPEIFLRSQLVARELGFSLEVEESSLTSITEENLSDIKGRVLDIEVEVSDSLEVKLELEREIDC